MPKIISKDHIPWRYFVNFLMYIYQLHFWLEICIAKNFIWTTLKAATTDSRFSNSRISAKNCPIISNHSSMETIHSAFRWCINLNKKMDPYDWVCGPGSQLLKWRTVILNCNNIYCFYCIFFSSKCSLGRKRHFSKTKIKYSAVKRSIAIKRIQNNKNCPPKKICVYIYVQ